jgi:hypothetical protein
MKTEGR